MDVGIRELKARLSEYVGRAADGETVVVTDRGRPVARLVPLAADDTVARGIDEGWIEPPHRISLLPPSPIRAPRTVMEALDEDRG